MTETITVEDIKRIAVNPGEVLMVRLPEDLPLENAQVIAGVFDSALPGAAIIIYRGEPIELTVVERKSAA